MHTRLVRRIIIVLISSRAFASGSDEKLREAYKQAHQNYDAAETVDAKLRIMKTFLNEYPESEHTVDVVDHIFYSQGIEQGDMNGTIAYTRGIRKKISDPQIAVDLDVKLSQMYSRAGRAEEFMAIAEPLAVSDRLSFTQHLDLIEAAVEVGDWNVARTSSERARRFANAEAYRSDYPSNVISDADAEAAAKNRVGILLTYQGWAKAHLGQMDQALAGFKEADGLLRKNAFGIPDRPLYVYWGKTLMMQGKHREAFERLALDGLIAGHREAHDALEEAYTAFKGTDEGFDAYALSYQRKVAKTLDEFTLPGFSGGEFSLADLKGRVTLVSFWHPG